ncbi:MAG: glutamate--tRNA ligase [Chitinophagaceae bacterium]|nr:glutamate--tRNA ligase [Chitinophagaceae bacterium]
MQKHTVIFAAMERKIRVRFAPSPTGGLHLGGVRTVLFNYLFAKKHEGDFILRIEDTDQTRYVEGAEQYIMDCLLWCGLVPDESPLKGGAYGPYRQSERKPMYRQYADQLVAAGFAYYAFDTPDELEEMRLKFKTEHNPAPTYGHQTRQFMKNSLTLSGEEVMRLMSEDTPYVVRILMPANEQLILNDLIRGEVVFDTNQSDDKVLLKADGMPTYHLAVVVDDYLMQITHAFRGEEWLSSAPVHLLLWQYLGWQQYMPKWAHLPLILGPDGAKLSKRHGNKYGFPLFAMNWTDPVKNEFTEGFRERGFLPEAFVNLLALMGWNPGTEQEVFSLNELIEVFSLERVHAAGAQFDFEKAKWFNHEWIKRLPAEKLVQPVKAVLAHKNIDIKDEAKLTEVVSLVKDRCTLLTDFAEQAGYFFAYPPNPDIDAIKPKWDAAKAAFFEDLAKKYAQLTQWNKFLAEATFKEMAQTAGLKPGELMLPMRIMLVGGRFGPGVFEVAALIGQSATANRIEAALKLLA